MSFGAEAGIVLALTALAGLLFGALLLLNWWHRRGDAREHALRRWLEPILAGWAARGAVPADLDRLRSLGPGDRRTVLLACLESLPDLAPEAAERVRDALRRSGMARRETAGLGARSALRRAEACRIAGRLGDPDAIPLLVERLRDRRPAVRREAIRALGDLRAVEALPEIADAVETLGEWDNLLLVMALVRMGPASASWVDALLRIAKSPAMEKALLQVTGRLATAADPALIRALAAHPESEVRVEAVRALGALPPDPESAAVCLAAMDDPAWPVRALAAWSLGRVGDERAIARLGRAMGDPAYWVRHHVAEALAALGERGEAALRGGLRDENPFVRDMAAQTLFMRGLPHGEAA